MADPQFDTATQMSVTGLDEGTRRLLLRVLEEGSGGDVDASIVASAFFRDRFGDPADYLRAVESVWGYPVRFDLQRAIADARADAGVPVSFGGGRDHWIAPSTAMLLHMPESDFRLAIQETFGIAGADTAMAVRIASICRSRGAPWTFSVEHGFEFVGDVEVERELIRPALAAINRPEFAGGVKQEFEAARAELASGTPGDLKQAVVEAGAAVESAMKVVLDANGINFDPRATAYDLLDRWRESPHNDDAHRGADDDEAVILLLSRWFRAQMPRTRVPRREPPGLCRGT